jgi:hypothetical protein
MLLVSTLVAEGLPAGRWAAKIGSPQMAVHVSERRKPSLTQDDGKGQSGAHAGQRTQSGPSVTGGG